MSNHDDTRDGFKLADRATLSLLSALEDDQQPTQRGLAQQLGVALGMTNNLLKRAVRKGLVKVKNAPAKRFAYYITPKGFSEKSRLVAEYLSSSLEFFRWARDQYADIYEQAQAHGHERVVLCGIGELAEIAAISAHESGVQVCGVIEVGSNQSHFAGVPVYASVEDALRDHVDAVVITATADPQAAFDLMAGHVEPARIYTAPLLHINRNGALKGEG